MNYDQLYAELTQIKERIVREVAAHRTGITKVKSTDPIFKELDALIDDVVIDEMAEEAGEN